MRFRTLGVLKAWLGCVERGRHVFAQTVGRVSAPRVCNDCGAREGGPTLLDLVRDFPIPDFRR